MGGAGRLGCANSARGQHELVGSSRGPPTLGRGSYCRSHFTDEETEAQSCRGTWLTSSAAAQGPPEARPGRPLAPWSSRPHVSTTSAFQANGVHRGPAPSPPTALGRDFEAALPLCVIQELKNNQKKTKNANTGSILLSVKKHVCIPKAGVKGQQELRADCDSETKLPPEKGKHWELACEAPEDPPPNITNILWPSKTGPSRQCLVWGLVAHQGVWTSPTGFPGDPRSAEPA